MPNAALRDPHNLNRLAYFASVVDAGSFTRAAERLGVSKAVVSQQVARLEHEVGTTLLVRTTRKVQPTDAGRALHARCVVILRESAEAFDELAQTTASPHGTLRVAAPFDYGTSIVVPVVAEFTLTYSHCEVVLLLSDTTVDRETVDVALHVGWPRDSSHVARRLGTFAQRLVCSPARVAEVSRVRRPEDLALLPFIANRSLPEPSMWRFTRDGRGRRTVRMRPRLTVDATPAVRAAVLAGAGLSILPDYLVDGDIASGLLIEVLPTWRLQSGGIHAVLPAARFRPAKVSRFLEMMSRAEAARYRC
jgi:DNA-binding transcriptional LysR family regulator